MMGYCCVLFVVCRLAKNWQSTKGIRLDLVRFWSFLTNAHGTRPLTDQTHELGQCETRKAITEDILMKVVMHAIHHQSPSSAKWWSQNSDQCSPQSRWYEFRICHWTHQFFCEMSNRKSSVNLRYSTIRSDMPSVSRLDRLFWAPQTIRGNKIGSGFAAIGNWKICIEFSQVTECAKRVREVACKIITLSFCASGCTRCSAWTPPSNLPSFESCLTGEAVFSRHEVINGCNFDIRIEFSTLGYH